MPPLPFGTVAVTLFISFFCVVSFAVTSFGGAIIFQLGWNICSLASERVCGSNLAIPLAMMTLGAFIQLPLQVMFLWRYVNVPLAVRFTIYQSIGTLAGVYVLIKYGADPSLRQILGLFLLALVVWFFWKEVRHRSDELAHASNKRGIVTLQEAQSFSTSFKPLRLISLIGDDSDGDTTNTYDYGRRDAGLIGSQNLGAREGVHPTTFTVLPQSQSSSWWWDVSSSSGFLSTITFGLLPSERDTLASPNGASIQTQSYSACYSSGGGSTSTGSTGSSSCSTGCSTTANLTPYPDTLLENKYIVGKSSSLASTAATGEYVSFSVSSKGTVSPVLFLPPPHDHQQQQIPVPHSFRRESVGDFDQFKIKTWSMELYILMAGTAAGVLGGLYGTSGPPLMVFVSTTGVEKDEWRATTSVAHLFENLVRTYLVLYREKVVDISQNWGLVLWYIVVLAFGLTVGDILAPRVNTSLWRQILLFLMLSSSSTLITAGCDPSISLVAFIATTVVYVIFYCSLHRGSS